MSKVLHPNEKEFQELYKNEDLLFIDFFASWCGPCKMLAPSVDQLANQHPEAKVMKIDVDAILQLLLNSMYNLYLVYSL